MSRAAHERLTELFAEAIELPPAERSALVDRVRADDAPLAEELSALLAADAKAVLATGGLLPTVDDKPIPLELQRYFEDLRTTRSEIRAIELLLHRSGRPQAPPEGWVYIAPSGPSVD